MKKKRWIPKVGDWVTIPWWEVRVFGHEAKRIRNLTGRIISIDGAYHYIKVTNNPKYDVVELYPVEFKKKPKRRKRK